MRSILSFLALSGLVFGLSGSAQGQDKPADIIDAAIKAYGGQEKLAKLKAVHSKAKGKLELAGGIDFTQEAWAQLSGQVKDAMSMETMGVKVNVVTVYNGKQGWMLFNGMTMDLTEEILKEVKESIYMMQLGQLWLLKDGTKFKLTPLGESQVNGKPAGGFKISSEGHKDVSMYFDKASHLLAKTERRVLDSTTMMEVTEERIIQEHHEVDGLKTAKKVLVNRDGKKFMEAEVLEAKFPEKIDESEFAKPQQ